MKNRCLPMSLYELGPSTVADRINPIHNPGVVNAWDGCRPNGRSATAASVCGWKSLPAQFGYREHRRHRLALHRDLEPFPRSPAYELALAETQVPFSRLSAHSD